MHQGSLVEIDGGEGAPQREPTFFDPKPHAKLAVLGGRHTPAIRLRPSIFRDLKINVDRSNTES